jgi:hypothetical protein
MYERINENEDDFECNDSIEESEFCFTVEVKGVLASDAIDYMMTVNHILESHYDGIVEIWFPRDNLFTVEYITSNAKEVASFDLIEKVILKISQRYCQIKY